MAAILVVEGDKYVYQFITLNLKLRGYDTLQAASVREGLQVLKACAPQLLILDIGLPDMSGWHMLKEIDSDLALPKLPVIIITVSFLANQPEEYPYPNIVGRFRKPFEVTDLLQVICSVC